MSEQKWQFEQDGLVINASRTNGKGTVAWRGVSDSRTPGVFLRPVLRELSEKMKGAEVTVDFTKLEYMNSATVSPLINFVKTLDGALHAHPRPVLRDATGSARTCSACGPSPRRCANTSVGSARS